METEILDDNNYEKTGNVIQYANFGERLLASLLDMLITIVPIGALMYLGYANKSLMMLIAASVVGILYKPIMEGVWGATIGKMILKIKMVDSNGEQIDLGQSVLKNAIYIISGVIGLLGHFWLAKTEAFQEAEGVMQAMGAGQGSPYGTVSLIWTLVMLVSIFAMLGSELKQTLHDKLAGTFCVKSNT